MLDACCMLECCRFRGALGSPPDQAGFTAWLCGDSERYDAETGMCWLCGESGRYGCMAEGSMKSIGLPLLPRTGRRAAEEFRPSSGADIRLAYSVMDLRKMGSRILKLQQGAHTVHETSKTHKTHTRTRIRFQSNWVRDSVVRD